MAYRMTHPDSSLHLKVEADMVKTYESQGWVTAPTAKSPDKDDDK